MFSLLVGFEFYGQVNFVFGFVEGELFLVIPLTNKFKEGS